MRAHIAKTAFLQQDKINY